MNKFWLLPFLMPLLLVAQPKSPANTALEAPSWLQKIEGKGYRDTWLLPINLTELNLLSGEYEPFIHLEGIGTVLLDKNKQKYLLRPIPATADVYPFAAPVVSHLAESLGLASTAPQIVRYLGNAYLIEKFVLDQVSRNDVAVERLDASLVAQAWLLSALVGDGKVYPTHFSRSTFLPIMQASTQAFSKKQGWGYGFNSLENGKMMHKSFSEKWHDLSSEIGLRNESDEVVTWAGFLPEDRVLLASLSQTEWMTLVKRVQQRLTDTVIAEAIQQMPPEIVEQDRTFLENALRKRRDTLGIIATRFYTALQAVPEGEKRIYQPSHKLHDYSFAFNDTDNTFVGWQTTWVKGGFKAPFDASHQLEWNIAPKTMAYNVDYQGRITDVVGKTDLLVDGYIWHHTNPHTFYPLGNETAKTQANAAFYQTQRWRTRWRVGIERNVQNWSWRTQLFGEYQRLYGDHPIGRAQEGVLTDVYQSRLFIGTEWGTKIHKTKNKDRWFQSGYQWDNIIRFSVNPSAPDERFANATTDLAFYHQMKRLNVSARLGAAHLFGEFPFYAANRLGQLSNLRGYWQRRLGGRSIAYANSEMRFKLFEFPYWDSNSRTGLLFFADTGRAWTDDEVSKIWHVGYGAGIWTEAYGVVLTASLGFSEENPKGLSLLRMQWQF